jgi:dienelactone hydrolase
MLDIIDGYFGVGFHVVQDPTTSAAFAHAGSFEYNEGTTYVAAPGEFEDPHSLEQKAVVYFPADVAGATNPAQISAAQAQYPLVVVVHGNNVSASSYLGYNYLMEHLARNGMIAASIHVYYEAKGVSRARALFKHLDILPAKFPGKIDLSKIGIMGHSRGGEAVVIAAKLNVDEALGYNFSAIISLAPTDQYGPYSLSGPYAVPYLVIYGGLDGDVAGDDPKSTGFSLYDRADPLKSMLFAERACHARFNAEWDDADLDNGWLSPTDQSKVLSVDAHRKIAKGYMNAFFLWHLYGRSELADFFTGDLTPAQVELAGGVVIHSQYRALGGLAVDRFTDDDWQSNDIGGDVTHNATLPVDPSEGDLVALDTFSPHDTTGGLIRWDAGTDIYLSQVPPADKDVTAYRFLSFRCSQRYGSAANPANADQELYVKLTDKDGNARSILVSKFATIPYPFVRGLPEPMYAGSEHLTKSALKTVRIPLDAYRIEVAGTQKVDLKKVESISFEFAVKPTGEIEIDDIEFGF